MGETKIDVKQLKCFLAVAEHRSFTKAAAAMYMTQPAISHQIAALERQLGVSLFLRNTHGVRLTRSGAIFKETVCRMTVEYDAVINRMRAMEAGLSGDLTVGFIGASETTWLPDCVNRFRSDFPDISVDLKRYNIIDLTRALNDGQIDVGFTLSVGLTENSDLLTHTTRIGNAVVVMRPDHPMATRRVLMFGDLKDERFVLEANLESSPVLRNLEMNCSRHGFTLKIAQWATDLETILAKVEAGTGISILSAHLVDSHPNYKIHYVPMEGEGSEVADVMIWKKRSGNPLVRKFVSFVTAVLPAGSRSG